MRFDAAAASEVGPHRTDNQDSALHSGSAGVVADGVGGGPSGDIASALLVHSFAASGVRPHDADDLRRRLRGANWDLGALARHDRSLHGMATTFTGIFLSDDLLLLAHVGDSRGYLLRGGMLTRRTRDDSFVQDLVDAVIVSAADAPSHPRRNVVTASFRGDDADGEALTVQSEPAAPGDRWLLCSDGVSDFLPEHDIHALLAVGDPPRAARALVDAALEVGSRDNVTAVVCDVVRGDAEAPGSREPITFVGAAAQRYREGIA